MAVGVTRLKLTLSPSTPVGGNVRLAGQVHHADASVQRSDRMAASVEPRITFAGRHAVGSLILRFTKTSGERHGGVGCA